MPSRLTLRRPLGAGLPLAVVWLALPSPAAAQRPAPTPTPTPPPREQDVLDIQRRSTIVGSGARALGMGGAFLARADDATAASWNPAGLSYLRRPEISLVGVNESLDIQSTTPEGPLTSRDHVSGTSPDLLSAAYPYSLGALAGSVQLSFQRVISFSGRRDTTGGLAEQRSDGQGGFDVLAVGTGLKLPGRLRAGFTLNRWFNGFTQRRERDPPRPSLQTTDFELSGFNFNAGLIWTPWETLNLGAVGKTRMSGDVRLARTRRDFAEDGTFTDNRYDSEAVRLKLPPAFGFGASWRPRNPLTLCLDYTKTFWSEARILNYFTLPPSVTGVGANTPPEVFASLPFPSVLDDTQEDSTQWRAGVEYVVILDRLKVPLRAGYFRDQQYTRAGNGEVPVFNGYTVGLGLLAGPFLFDFAYVRESGDRDGAVDDPGRETFKLERVLFSMIFRRGP